MHASRIGMIPATKTSIEMTTTTPTVQTTILMTKILAPAMS